MSRKNAFLFTLLLTFSSTPAHGYLKPETIAKAQVFGAVILAACSVCCLEDIYDFKQNSSESWFDALKDSRVQIDITFAALFLMLSGWTFDKACNRLGIQY